MRRGLTPAVRRLVLIASALGAVIRGLAYMPWTWGSSGVKQLSPVEAWMPLWVWGWVWIGIGVLIGLAVVRRSLSITAMSALTGILILWGASYLWAWAFQDVMRSWVTGGLFLVMAVWSGVLASLLERRR